MKDASPEGPVWSFYAREYRFSDYKRLVQFYRASRLYDTQTENHREYPPEATDTEVREAIEDLERTEATDAEVRAIFADEGPKGRTANLPAPITGQEADQ